MSMTTYWPTVGDVKSRKQRLTINKGAEFPAGVHPAPSNSKGLGRLHSGSGGSGSSHKRLSPPINSYRLRLGPELAQNRIESKIRSQGREKCTPDVSPQAVIVLAARNEQICH